MKAVVLYETGGPEAFKVEDIPMPKLKPTEVLIKVAACGLCGHDQADRNGLTRVDKPVVLGHEISGTVVEIGSMVRHIKTGDRVATKQHSSCGNCIECRSMHDLQCSDRETVLGGYAEYAAVADGAVIKIPNGVDIEGASIVACAIGTSLRGVRHHAKVTQGEMVVVTGAGGGLGLHALQVVKAFGAYTVAITTSPHKVDSLKEYGADEVIVAHGDDYWQEILDKTRGKGPQVVIDPVGHPDVFKPCFRALAREGRYVFLGQVYRQKVDFFPAFLHGKEANLTGGAATRMNEFLDSMEMVNQRLVTPVIQKFSLSDAVEAWRQVDARKVFGRAVLVP